MLSFLYSERVNDINWMAYAESPSIAMSLSLSLLMQLSLSWLWSCPCPYMLLLLILLQLDGILSCSVFPLRSSLHFTTLLFLSILSPAASQLPSRRFKLQLVENMVIHKQVVSIASYKNLIYLTFSQFLSNSPSQNTRVTFWYTFNHAKI
jgi:hypothetical protein